MSEPEHIGMTDEELSVLYEKSLRDMVLFSRIGNAMLAVMPGIGLVNYIYANQAPLSKYVAGSMLAGLLFKGATVGVNASLDKFVLTPNLKLQQERLRCKFEDDEEN